MGVISIINNGTSVRATPREEIHIIDSGGTALPSSRVDALSLIRRSNGQYFGVYNWFPEGGGGDTDTAYLKVVTGDGYSWQTAHTLPLTYEGQMNGHLYEQANGDLILISLVKLSTEEELTFMGWQKSTDGGLTWTTPVEISSDVYGDAWIPISGRIYKDSDGVVMCPTAALTLPDTGVRNGMLLLSYDDGETWEFAESSGGTVLSMDNSGTGSIAQVVVEPCIYRNSDFEFTYAYRNKDGYVNCRIIERKNGYFNPGEMEHILAAPASTSHIIHLPKINKWLAVHNDPADGIEGGTARPRMRYSLSDTGKSGEFTQSATFLYNNEYAFEPTLLDAPEFDGVFISYTFYESATYNLIIRFLKYTSL